MSLIRFPLNCTINYQVIIVIVITTNVVVARVVSLERMGA